MDVHARLRHWFILGSITNILLQYMPWNVHSVSSFLVCFAVFSFQLFVDSRELFIRILQDCFTGTCGSWIDGPHPQFGFWYICDRLNVMICIEMNLIIIWQLTPKVFNHTCIVFICPLKNGRIMPVQCSSVCPSVWVAQHIEFQLHHDRNGLNDFIAKDSSNSFFVFTVSKPR